MTRETILFLLLITTAVADHSTIAMIKIGELYPIFHYGLWIVLLCLSAKNSLSSQKYKR